MGVDGKVVCFIKESEERDESQRHRRAEVTTEEKADHASNGNDKGRINRD